MHWCEACWVFWGIREADLWGWVNTAGDTQSWWLFCFKVPFTHLSACLLRGCALILARWSADQAFMKTPTCRDERDPVHKQGCANSSTVQLECPCALLRLIKVTYGSACVADSVCGWDCTDDNNWMSELLSDISPWTDERWKKHSNFVGVITFFVVWKPWNWNYFKTQTK